MKILLMMLVVLFATPALAGKEEERKKCLMGGGNPVLCKVLLNDPTRIPPPPVDIEMPLRPIEPPSEIARVKDRRNLCEKNPEGCASYIIVGTILTFITLGYLSYWYSYTDEVEFSPNINADEDGFRSATIRMKVRF